MLHKFDINYFPWYIFSSINDSILKLMMPIESSILLKNHVSCNFMLKFGNLCVCFFCILDICVFRHIMFRHNFAYMVNSCVVSLRIAVMINIFQ